MSTTKVNLTTISEVKEQKLHHEDICKKMELVEEKLVEFDKALAEVMGRVYIMEDFLQTEFLERVKEFRDIKVKQFKKIKDNNENYIEDQLNKTLGIVPKVTTLTDKKDEKK